MNGRIPEITVTFSLEPQQLRLQNAIDRILFEMRFGGTQAEAQCGDPGRIRQFLNAAEHSGEPEPHRPVHTTPEPENDQRVIIRFEDGIYGFEDIKDYVLLQEDDSQVIWTLRAAYAPCPSFIAVNPFLLVMDYKPRLTEEDFRKLGSPAEEDLCFLAIAVIRRNVQDSAANLKSPVVINAKLKTGRQIIMDDTDYPVRYRLFADRVQAE